MLLSPEGLLRIMSAFANIITIAGILNIGTPNTAKYSQHPLVKLVFLYSFAYSVVPDKTAVLVAVGLFFTLEIQNFVFSETSNIISNIINPEETEN